MRRAIVMVLCLGCGRGGFDAVGEGTDGGLRGDGTLAGGMCGLADGAWTLGLAERVDAVSSADEELDPVLTADALTLYFARRVGNDFDVFRATRLARDGPFMDVTPVAEANTPADDWHFAVTSDGMSAYLSTQRMGGPGSADVWLGRRAGPELPFGDFAPVPNVNSGGPEHDPSPSADDLRLYYQTGGPPDLIVASRSSVETAFDPPQPIDELNSLDGDDSPTVPGDELHIFFGSNRDGDRDLYHASRAARDRPFENVARLDQVSIVGEPEHEPHVSYDGCELFFQRAGDLYRAPIVPR